MQNNPQNSNHNPYTKRIDDTSKQLSEGAFAQNLQGRYSDRPYSETWKLPRWGAVALSYVANLYSFLTAILAIGLVLSLQIAFVGPNFSFALSLGLAALIGAIIEVIKRGTARNFFYNGYLYRNWRGGVLFGMLFISGVSIGLSFYGSTQIPTTFDDTDVPLPTLVSIEEIEQRYAEKIASKEETKTKMLSLAATSSTARHSVPEIENDINDLDKKRTDEIKAAKEENKRLGKEYDDAVDNKNEANVQQGFILGWICLATELAFLLCFWFNEKYLFNSAVERGLIVVGKDRNYFPPTGSDNDNKSTTQNQQNNQSNQRTSNKNNGSNAGSATDNIQAKKDRVVVKGFANTNTLPNDIQNDSLGTVPKNGVSSVRTEIHNNTQPNTHNPNTVQNTAGVEGDYLAYSTVDNNVESTVETVNQNVQQEDPPIEEAEVITEEKDDTEIVDMLSEMVDMDIPMVDLGDGAKTYNLQDLPDRSKRYRIVTEVYPHYVTKKQGFVLMPMARLKNRRDDYMKRLKEKLKKGSDEKTIQNQKNWIGYWTQAIIWLKDNRGKLYCKESLIKSQREFWG